MNAKVMDDTALKIGIDLGTSRSAIAASNDQHSALCIANREYILEPTKYSFRQAPDSSRVNLAPFNRHKSLSKHNPDIVH